MSAAEQTIGPGQIPLTLEEVRRLQATDGALWLRGTPYRVVRVVSTDGTWRAVVRELQR